MKINLGQVKAAEPLFVAFTKTPLPFLTAFKMGYFLDRVATIVENINFRVKELKEEFNHKDGDTPSQALLDAVEKYLAIEVEIDSEKFKFSEFPENIMLTPTDIKFLEPFLEKE